MKLLSLTLIAILVAVCHSNPIGKELSASKYFNSFEWIVRDGVLSLSIDHKQVSIFDQSKAWDEVVMFNREHENWRNEGSLKAQFNCHVQFAPTKNPWNLEPHRVTTSWLTTTLNMCNPPREYLEYLLRDN